MAIKSMFRKEFLHRVFIRDKAVMLAVVFAAFFQLVAWFFLIWRGLPLRERGFIPLHYTIYFGVDAFGPWYKIFLPVAVGLLLFLINLLIIIYQYERERIYSYIFAIGGAIAELIILAASIFTILLNI